MMIRYGDPEVSGTLGTLVKTNKRQQQQLKKNMQERGREENSEKVQGSVASGISRGSVV